MPDSAAVTITNLLGGCSPHPTRRDRQSPLGPARAPECHPGRPTQPVEQPLEAAPRAVLDDPDSASGTPKPLERAAR